MTDLNNIVKEISNLEKRFETEIEQIKQLNKQEEIKFFVEIEKFFITEIKKFENILLEKNKNQIIEFENNIKERYKIKLLDFEKKLEDIDKNINIVLEKIKEKILSYGNR